MICWEGTKVGANVGETEGTTIRIVGVGDGTNEVAITEGVKVGGDMVTSAEGNGVGNFERTKVGS